MHKIITSFMLRGRRLEDILDAQRDRFAFRDPNLVIGRKLGGRNVKALQIWRWNAGGNSLRDFFKPYSVCLVKCFSVLGSWFVVLGFCGRSRTQYQYLGQR